MQFTQIEVTVTKDGQVTLHVRGVKGNACRQVTADLEAALGSNIRSRTPTAEAYENPTEIMVVQQQIGSTPTSS